MAERAEDVLRRELYWMGERRATGPLRDLRARAEGLADALQRDLARRVPDDPSLSTGSAFRRFGKRLLARVIRPVTRRQDLLLAELTSVSLELLDHLGRLEDELRRLDGSPDAGG